MKFKIMFKKVLFFFLKLQRQENIEIFNTKMLYIFGGTWLPVTNYSYRSSF